MFIKAHTDTGQKKDICKKSDVYEGAHIDVTHNDYLG